MTDTVRLVAVGDIFLADSPLNVGRGVRLSLERHGHDYFAERVHAFTSGSDLCFGNVETILSEVNLNRARIGSVEIRGASSSIELLSRCGFNVVNVANNHIFQHGIEAYRDTVQNLRRAGITVVGDELLGSNLQELSLRGTTIGIVGYSLHYEQYRPRESAPYALREDAEDILSEISEIRKSFHGTLICSLHWGYEFLDRISRRQREFCHRLVDGGVDVVLGHHSHVPQALERYGNGLISYSLGNFIFDMESDFTRKSFALDLKIGPAGVISETVVPFSIRDDFCPYPLAGNEAEDFRNWLARLSDKAVKGECPDDDEIASEAKSVYAEVSFAAYKRFFLNATGMNPYYVVCLMVRALLRRLGLLHNP